MPVLKYRTQFDPQGLQLKTTAVIVVPPGFNITKPWLKATQSRPLRQAFNTIRDIYNSGNALGNAHLCHHRLVDQNSG